MPTIDFGFLPPPLGWRRPWSVTTRSGLVSLDLPVDTSLMMVIKAKRKDLKYGKKSFGPYPPLGWPPLPMNWSWAGRRQTLYVAATISRSTVDADTPSSEFIPEKLQSSVNFGRGVFSGADPLSSGSSGGGSGVIELLDPENDLDYLYEYVLDGAQIEIFRGNRDQLFSSWLRVGVFFGASNIVTPEAGKKSIRLRDLGWQLNTPLHSEYFKGTGGLEGGTDLENVIKPYTIGYAGGITPSQIDTLKQVFLWSWTSSQALVTAMHAGVPIVVDAYYTTYDALLAAVIPAGKCAVCLEVSCVRFNITIDKPITLNVVGDADLSFGRPSPNSRADIIFRMATAYGAQRLSILNDIDGPAFSAFNDFHGAPCGFFFDAEITKAQAINDALEGVMGWGHVKPNGQYTIGYARDFSSELSLAIEYKSNGMSFPLLIDTIPPRASTSISWGRNYTVLTRDQIAGSVTEAQAALLTRDAGWAKESTDYVPQVYSSAPNVIVMANFRYEVDASTEAQRQQSLMRTPKGRWQWSMEIDQFADMVDKVFVLEGANVVNLGSSKRLLLVDADSLGRGRVTLGWWGEN